MKWSETTASNCRYGDIAEKIWGESEILWEESEADYQGHATILAKMPDGKYSFYEWWYGSCSGCDTWEAEGLSDEAIEKAMRRDAVWFTSRRNLVAFLKQLQGGNFANYNATRTPTLEMGQMLDLLGGETPTRLAKMANEVLKGDELRLDL